MPRATKITTSKKSRDAQEEDPMPTFQPLERHESVCAEGDPGLTPTLSRTLSRARSNDPTNAKSNTKASKNKRIAGGQLDDTHNKESDEVDSDITRAGSDVEEAASGRNSTEKSRKAKDGAGTVPDQSSLEKGTSAETSSTIHDYPEGGLKAWLVVAGTWICVFWSFGFANTFGVFQSYYTTTILTERSASEISWIGSFQYFLIYGMGLVCGRAFDLGLFKPVLFVGIILWTFSMMMISLCTEYWQLFLAQGLGLGMAMGICFNIAVSLPTHYFSRRRAWALGIQASGSSVGGTVLPIMISRLIPRIGFPWTIRLLGFLGFTMMLAGWLIMETRFPPLMPLRNGGWKKVRWVDLSEFKTVSYTLFCVGATVIFFGLYNMFTYIDVFAEEYRIPAGDYLLPILNAASTFGRVIPGFYADKIGRFNMLLPTLFCASIVLFFWSLATKLGGILPVLILYGAFSGTYVSIIPSCIAQVGSVRTIGTRVGMCFAMISIAGLVSTPIGGALIGAGGKSGWTKIAVFSGSVALGGTLILVASRQVATKGKVFVKF